MAKLGFRKLDDLIGRVDLLEQIDDPENPKTRMVNLSGLLHDPDPTGESPRIHTRPRNERLGFEGCIDQTIIQESKDVISGRVASFRGKYKVGNTDRCLGTHLSGEVAYIRGSNHLPPASIDLKFIGTAGQSFGTFLSPGIRMQLFGEANDYVGKGMSGGEIIVRPKEEETFVWKDNIIVGNTCLYGSTGGHLFAAGCAGERFGVRNSGAVAVVEGLGDHACEYMTGGLIVSLGKTGSNFGAGMSGGLAFIYDEDNSFENLFNPELIGIERLGENAEIDALKKVVEAHATATQSPYAKTLLENWENTVSKFWKAVPHPATPETPKNVLKLETLNIPAYA